MCLLQHPWETFSPLSPHWVSSLAILKTAEDYEEVTKSIPEQAKARFVEGAGALYAHQTALEDLYEPMIYLARCVSKALHGDDGAAASAPGPCGFQVLDTEFNSLALRSAHALVQIAHVLVDQSSVCSDFKLSRKEMLVDVAALRAVEARLKAAILGGGNASQPRGLWNATSRVRALVLLRWRAAGACLHLRLARGSSSTTPLRDPRLQCTRCAA